MINKLLPDFYVKDIFSIKPSFFIKNDIKIIFSDLDNTLVTFDTIVSNDKVKKWVDEIKKNNIKLIIVSNNSNPRIIPVANKLGLDFVSWSLKPTRKGVRNAYKKFNIDSKEKIAMIGDQFFTDILVGKRIKNGVTILTKPLIEKDSKFTLINRFFEKKFLKQVDKSSKIVWENELK